MKSPSLTDDPNEGIIKSIVSIEWDMFDKVNNFGGRASCQDDRTTFYVMRRSQFSAWDGAVLESYEADLKRANEEGINLVELKYAYMMSYDNPKYFKTELAPFLPPVSPEKSEAVDAIMEHAVAGFREAAEKFPFFTRRGRPENGTPAGAGTSFDVYMRGELLTYSENTLGLYLEMLKNKRRAHVNFACEIYNSTAKSYGFAGLDEAESVLKKQGAGQPAL